MFLEEGVACSQIPRTLLDNADHGFPEGFLILSFCKTTGTSGLLILFLKQFFSFKNYSKSHKLQFSGKRSFKSSQIVLKLQFYPK